MGTGVFGAMIKLSAGNNASQNYTAFKNAIWPPGGGFGTGQAFGMKTYFNNTNVGGPQMSDGSGFGSGSTNGSNTFPTSFGSDAAYGLANNFQVIIACYKPWMNLGLNSYDATAGSPGTTGASGSTHGGTKADWSALSASVSALSAACNAAGAKLYVVLWQEIEHMHAPGSGGGMNLQNYQYWSSLAWYGGAVYGSVASGGAGLPKARLLHNASASYSGQLDNFFPANQGSNGGPVAALVGGGTTDCYSRDYAAGYRFDSVTSGSKYATPLVTHCANAGIPFMGVLEFGVGGNNVPSNQTILDYFDHVNTVAGTGANVNGFYFWYGEYQDSGYGLIPGFSSGQSFTETNPNPPPATITIGPGPDATPKLRAIFNTIYGSVPPLLIDTLSLHSGPAFTPYSDSIISEGGVAPYSYSKDSGTLPAGVRLNSDGTITGTPTVAGNFSFTPKVTDSSTPPLTAITSSPLTITITATAQLQITTQSCPMGVKGAPYPDFTLEAANGIGTLRWQVINGTLPAGLSLDPNTGTISGTPL